MNRFSDFSTEQLIGEKISIDKILNKEIKVLAFSNRIAWRIKSNIHKFNSIKRAITKI